MQFLVGRTCLYSEGDIEFEKADLMRDTLQAAKVLWGLASLAPTIKLGLLSVAITLTLGGPASFAINLTSWLASQVSVSPRFVACRESTGARV